MFPDSYKIAQVIPLFKGGDREDPHCYRPISLLPTISKIATINSKIAMHRPGSSLKNSLGKNPFNTKVPKFGTPYHLKLNLVSP